MTPTYREKHQLLFFSASVCMIPASYRRSQNIYWAILLARMTRLLDSSLFSDLNFYMAKESSQGNYCLLKNTHLFYNQFFFKSGEEDTFLFGNLMH